MIVLSLVLVVAAAVSLFIGLFTDPGLPFIYAAIVLCVVSLLLLWVGTRMRKSGGRPSRADPESPVYGGQAPGMPSQGAPEMPADAMSAPYGGGAAPSYGGGAAYGAPAGSGAAPSGASSAGYRGAGVPYGGAPAPTSPAPTIPAPTIPTPGATPAPSPWPASSPDEDDVAEPAGDSAPPADAEVVRKTTARERAVSRVTDAEAESTPPPVPDEAPPAPAPLAKKATARKATAKKATAKKATAKKSTAKKSTAKKATAKKATAKKATAKKATAKKATAKKSTARQTTGAAARARLSEISGVGPAKQDALLAQYRSLEAVRAASVDDIVDNVKGFGEALASRVKDELS